ncbi:hypothetical protein HAX54_032044 [Datura stramonium]|uniref:Uncharacterized protein n=1 Tax=Datura stramonium TaxID=4076 RepID=A0ABS8SCF1_DATST|nr:hypothetical protein [Datura stramonium]
MEAPDLKLSEVESMKGKLSQVEEEQMVFSIVSNNISSEVVELKKVVTKGRILLVTKIDRDNMCNLITQTEANLFFPGFFIEVAKMLVDQDSKDVDLEEWLDLAPKGGRPLLKTEVKDLILFSKAEESLH